jgi:prolyl-tRNA editing enzyme YbaK/EbsC (Cys-tRNA(Pro) deacylase)
MTMNEPLHPDNVQQALDAFGLGIQVMTFEQSTATSQMAADALGCELGQIAKSICFLVDGLPVLVVTCGDQNVDDKKIAEMFGVGRKKVKFAKADECIAIWGYAPGGVPPLGHREPMHRVFLDNNFQRYTQVYAAAGSANTIFPLNTNQLEQITGGTFADIARVASSNPEQS